MTAAELGLQRGARILVDSGPLIYLIEGSQLRRRTVESFLAVAAEAEFRLFASTIVWAELLRKPLVDGNVALAAAYRKLLAESGNLVLVPVDVAIAEAAAGLGAVRGLPVADCLHIATALVLRVDAVLGNDESWRGLPECPRLLLVDELAFDIGEQP